MPLSPAPAAGSPLSGWAPPAPVRPLVASYLAEEIDPETGEVTSLVTGMDPTDATLITLARTTRRSGAVVQDIGHRLVDIDMATDDAPKRAEHEVTALLRPLVERREIEVLELSTDVKGTLGAVFVRYRNTRTGEEYPLAIGA